MKKFLLFLLIGLAITTTSSAQAIFQDSIAYARFNSTINTVDNGFLLGGYSYNYSSSPDTSAAYFIKLNNVGNVDWTKAVSLPGVNCYTQTVLEIATGYLAAVNAEGSIVLIQLDKQGNIINTKKLEQVNQPNCTHMITTNDGGYAITGNILSNGFRNVLFIKLDKDLNVRGAESININGGDGYAIANSLIQTSDGSYVFTGDYYNEFTGTEDQVLTIKTNSKGKVIWANFLGGDNIDYGQDVVETPAGNYFVEAFSDSLVTVGDFLFLQYRYRRQYYVGKESRK